MGARYGIVEGHCNRDDIGTVLGAVVGGAIGSQVGEGSNALSPSSSARCSARSSGTNRQDLDEGDRACVGHSLELVKLGQRVRG